MLFTYQEEAREAADSFISTPAETPRGSGTTSPTVGEASAGGIRIDGRASPREEAREGAQEGKSEELLRRLERDREFLHAGPPR